MNRTLVAGFAALALGIAMSAQAQIAGNPHVDPGAPCFRWPAGDMDGDGVFDRLDHCINTPTGCAVDYYGCSVDVDGDGVCDGIDQCPNTAAGASVNKSGCSPDQLNPAATRVTPPPTPAPSSAQSPPPAQMGPMERQFIETGTIRLENIYFEKGKAQLLSESEADLRTVAEALEKYPALHVEIQGHTDTRGTEAYNQRLSQARAEAVRSFILKHSRLEADHLVAKGYGESHPETGERNDEERERNRRVVLKVLNPDALPRGVKIKNER